jgi:predicted anti-sigma-YlaC factor YlaD
MNCEKYQNLLSDFIDGSLTPEDHNSVEAHLSVCVVCAEAKSDLDAIVGFCLEHRGEYDAVPNERALWLRISNMIEVGATASSRTKTPEHAGRWFRLMSRSWQLSFPQLAGAATAIVVVAAIFTVVSVRGWNSFGGGSSSLKPGLANVQLGSSVADRYRQQQQIIEYWNQRVELNKARWNSQMRETFDRNMSVIDAAVNDSMRQLNQNPHDEVSEEILNAALNDKVELLKEFSEL